MEFKYTVGCETTEVSDIKPLNVLQAFKDLADPETRLLLMCKRSEKNSFSARNYLEKNGLEDRVNLLQYYDHNESHDLRKKCRVWIKKNSPAVEITAARLEEKIRRFQGEQVEVSDGKKRALFFTGFHPYQEEGQASYMRMWLDLLGKTGFEVHLVHYQNDLNRTSPEIRSRAAKDFKQYYEIPVTSGLVGRNEHGLNIDLDDWCGKEALRGVESLADRYDYDFCFVFYPFYSAVFTVFPPETRKVLISPDSFADRNRKMLEQGFAVAEWVSITRGGEQLACLRADMIVSIKEEEAGYFRELVEDQRKVVTAASVSPVVDFKRRSFSGKLRIGYFGSDTRVNRECAMEFLACRARSEFLSANSTVVFAGRFSEGMEGYKDNPLMLNGNVEIMGRLEDMADLYRETDLIVNPEKGGTGLKIKTLEPMYFGMPVVSTALGASGLNSVSRFHEAAEIRALIPLLEEIIRNPELLEELSSLSREITGKLKRKSLEGIGKVLGCSPDAIETKHLPLGRDGAGGQVLSSAFTNGSGNNNDLPLISVILPFFNAEKNLEKAVSSVTGHDYRNLELILVDDGSDDDSPRIAANLADRDSRIRIIRHPRNQGAGPARNTGVHNAAGDYLFFLDSDDILRRRALEVLLRTARKEGVRLVIGSCNQIDENGNYSDYDRNRDSGRKSCFGIIDGMEALRRSLNIDEGSFLPVRPWGMLIDLQLFRDSGLTFPSGEYEDLSVIPFLYKYAGKVVYLEDIVVTYRIRKGSVTQSPLNQEKVERYHLLWDVISSRIGEFGLEDYRTNFKIFHIGHLLWLLNHGISDREILVAAAELVHGKMSIRDEVFDGKMNLGYMLNYISSIMGAAGMEKDFALWEKFVSFLGDEVIISFFRHRMHEIGYREQG